MDEGHRFLSGSGVRIRADKSDAQIVDQMNRIVLRIAQRMGIGKAWDVHFELVQDEFFTQAIAVVYPRQDVFEGGEIVIVDGDEIEMIFEFTEDALSKATRYLEDRGYVRCAS